MKVAILTPTVPAPDQPYAGAQYLSHRISDLRSAGHEVAIVAPDRRENRAVSSCPAPVYLFPCGERYTRAGLPALSHAIALLFRGLSLGRGARSGFRACETCRKEIDTADAVELHYAPMLSLVRDLRARHPRTPIVAVEHDVLALDLASRSRSDSPIRRLAARLRKRRVATEEVRLLARCDAVAVFNSHEADYLEESGLPSRPLVLAPWLDRPTAASDPKPGFVLFVGAFDRPPNEEGARWLVERVWPSVAARLPEAHLRLVGANPAPWMRRLDDPTISVSGFVPDLDRYYREAAVAVAPLHQGAGLKFKIPQAMLYGLPVVATPLGAHGIDRTDASGAEIIQLAESPEDFAEAIVRLLSEDHRRAQLGASARSHAMRSYDFFSSSSELTSELIRLSEDRG